MMAVEVTGYSMW